MLHKIRELVQTRMNDSLGYPSMGFISSENSDLSVSTKSRPSVIASKRRKPMFCPECVFRLLKHMHLSGREGTRLWTRSGGQLFPFLSLFASHGLCEEFRRCVH